MKPIKIFIGYDPRQALTYTTLQHSILHHTKRPFSITPLVLDFLPTERAGLTPFTYTRFLVPWLCNYEGWAIFMDSDMIARGDLGELWDLQDEDFTAMVVKNPKRFEWASLILYNNAKCKMLSPETIDELKAPHLFDFCAEEEVGALPSEWNHLVGYDPPRFDAKIIHYTQGIPAHDECKGCEYTDEWYAEHQIANYTMGWDAVMGNSVHVAVAGNKRLPKFRLGLD